MKFSIINNQLHVVMTPEQFRKLSAALTSKRIAKMKVGPFPAIFEVVEEVQPIAKETTP